MSTGIGAALRDLANAVDAMEAAGARVTDVEPAAADGADGTVELGCRVRVPLLPEEVAAGLSVTVEDAAVDDGTIELALAATSAAEPADAPAGTDEDGGVDRADVDRSGNGSGADATRAADGGDAAELPAYRDPERLRAAYEAHDSFPAMTEALGVDVTPQTVRRHMIEHGIHEPDLPADGGTAPAGDAGDVPTDDAGTGEAGSTDTAGGASDEADATDRAAGGDAADGEGPDDAPSAAADGTGGPPPAGLADVTTEELTEAVRTARTIHEVAQRLDVPRERAFRLLKDLDLVDLVSGRLEAGSRTISAEELEQRIDRATATGR